jgi:ribosome-associated protein
MLAYIGSSFTPYQLAKKVPCSHYFRMMDSGSRQEGRAAPHDVVATPAEDTSGIRINARVTIPRTEIGVRTTRSSGAGGQHVNKTESRVELVWNVQTSRALSDAQRARVATALASRLTAGGELRIVASETRSQHQNRELAEARLADTVRAALIVPKVRKPTKPSKAAKRARLDKKRKHSEKKRERRRPVDD